ncbi:MAG: alpha/beta hydrolase [Desulfobacula sp.]|nr:alpha/beta hydrolase [Desulfobacula sp.]
MNSHIISAIFKFLKTRPSFDTVGIESYRQLLEKGAMAFQPDKSVKCEAFHIDHIPAEWLTPPKISNNRVIFYVHGGGYIAGSINSHRALASRIALAANARLLIFEYRLAPEHPFPAGLTDVNTAYQWLVNKNVLDKNNYSKSICIMGDSAGGGLSLALLAQILNENLPKPACSILISPWIDLECNNTSHIENREKDPMLGQKVLKKTARLYTDKDLSHPLISPIHNNFSGCCPVLIQVGENEVLLDDAKLLTQKLKQAGANVELEVWKDMFHVWHYFARYLSEGQRAIKIIGKFIQHHIHN